MTTVARWRKARASSGNQGCVEIVHTKDKVRDSKNPDGPRLEFGGTSAVEALTRAIKDGKLS